MAAPFIISSYQNIIIYSQLVGTVIYCTYDTCLNWYYWMRVLLNTTHVVFQETCSHLKYDSSAFHNIQKHIKLIYSQKKRIKTYMEGFISWFFFSVETPCCGSFAFESESRFNLQIYFSDSFKRICSNEPLVRESNITKKINASVSTHIQWLKS